MVFIGCRTELWTKSLVIKCCLPSHVTKAVCLSDKQNKRKAQIVKADYLSVNLNT